MIKTTKPLAFFVRLSVSGIVLSILHAYIQRAYVTIIGVLLANR